VHFCFAVGYRCAAGLSSGQAILGSCTQRFLIETASLVAGDAETPVSQRFLLEQGKICENREPIQNNRELRMTASLQ
jgi:hypothetical protein